MARRHRPRLTVQLLIIVDRNNGKILRMCERTLQQSLTNVVEIVSELSKNNRTAVDSKGYYMREVTRHTRRFLSVLFVRQYFNTQVVGVQ